ncbi:tail fiber assembly protein [Aeromonas hydrophila]|uniref:Tail fiber assembly protein n=1 Tax=Aeromonas hydrophila TaxID=644 RepID=A0A926IZ55_AERHY|nr:tail fiber assembly protein [Aeromonas hydrophila]
MCPQRCRAIKLLEWKKYRAELAVIDCTHHPVQWPAKPL